MTHPNRRKGDQWERDCVAFAHGHGFLEAERAYGAGRPDDVGDLYLFPGFVTSCKNEKRIELAEYMDEVEEQRERAGASSSLVIVKRRLRPAGDAYAIQTLDQVLSRELRWLCRTGQRDG